jgi:hypothetical protein
MSNEINVAKGIGFHYDPIYLDYNGWYFYDETYCNVSGPFPSWCQCVIALIRYCNFLNGEFYKKEE